MSVGVAGYAPLADAEWPTGLEDMRERFAGGLNVYRVMAHHPALLRAWGALRQHLVVESTLSAEVREVVTLRVGHRWRAHYEWAQHVVRGREAGLSDVRIAACRAKVPAGRDALLIEAVDRLLADGRLAPALRDEVTKMVGRHGLFDLFATVGMYSMLAFILNTLEVPLEPAILAALADRPLAG